MKRAFLLRIILPGLLSIIAFGGNAREFTYQGSVVPVDQPEGDLQYYNVECQTSIVYSDLTTYTTNFILPIVFAADGKVYTRNLTYGDRGNLWVEGKVEGDDIIFFPNSEISFSPIYVLWFNGNPFSYLKLGIYNPEKNKIEEDESLDQLVFSKTEDGGYVMNMPESTGILVSDFSPKLRFNYTLKPSLYKPVTPPPGYQEEDYQINFIPFAQTFISNRFTGSQKRAALRLKAVRTETEIYLKGLSFMAQNPDLWIRGNIVGNKVVFPHGEFIGIGKDDEPIYANVVEYELDYLDNPWGHSHKAITVTALNQDLTFDYDPETGTLSNPSACWDLSDTPDHSWDMDLSSDMQELSFVGNPDFYNSPQLKKIPENHIYKPLTPSVSSSSYSKDGRVSVSYLDADGYMMDPYKMYVKTINSKDGIAVKREFYDVSDWEKEYSEMYCYGEFYLNTTQGLEGVGCNVGNNQYVFNDPDGGKTYRYELYYIDGENSYSSDTSGIGYQPMSKDDNSPYYDLTGREINPHTISSGIYIHNGKKILIP